MYTAEALRYAMACLILLLLALLTGLAPVAAAVTGVLLGGPAPTPLVWAGIVVVAAGLTAGFRSRRD